MMRCDVEGGITAQTERVIPELQSGGEKVDIIVYYFPGLSFGRNGSLLSPNK